MCKIIDYVHITGLFNDTIIPEGVLYTYLTAWSRNNQSLTNAYILHHFNKTKISIMYRRSKETLCFTTKGMSWQNLIEWTTQECTNAAGQLMLIQQSTRNNKVPASSRIL